jgi:pyruvate-formate lyase
MDAAVAEQPAGPATSRANDAWNRAGKGDLGPFSMERAAWSAEVLAACRALPRKLQIARLLEAACARMPLHVAPGELVIGSRTAGGYPEIDDAINRGAAEPGYMIADYPTVLSDGMEAVIARCARALDGLDESRPEQTDAVDTLQSMIVSCRAVIRLAGRYADECLRLAETETDPSRREELVELARVCRAVPAQPARTLHEAIQSLWLAHLGVYLECDDCAFSLGRLDQYLEPFYQADLAAGRTSPERALELLECLWAKIYENVRGDLMHVQTVTIGGVTPEGRDAANAMTRLILRATREMGLLGPSIALRCHAGTPEDLVAYSLETMRLGRYMPQFYNDDQMVPALVSCGIPLGDARDYGLIGCHEPSICGKSYSRPASWPGYFCIPRALELALGNGRMLDTGAREGPSTGDPGSWRGFPDLWDAFAAQMRHMLRVKVIAANRGEAVKSGLMPRPFLSALTAGCIESGRDFTQGGALYNTSGIQAFGVGTCADSLAAIRRLCFESRELDVPALVEVLRADWRGHEELRLRVRNTFPHYGNDDDEADSLAARMIALLQEEVGRYTNARGGPFLLGLWSFTSHVKHGRELAASADGRLRGQPLSHSLDPSAGCGSAGPTAIVRSAAKIDASRAANGGSLLIEIQPSLLGDAESLKAVSSLLRTYLSLGGIQLQLSAVAPETLEAAVKDPERYAHIVVRVAGYSDYFVRLAGHPELQAYVIAREKYARIGGR